MVVGSSHSGGGGYLTRVMMERLHDGLPLIRLTNAFIRKSAATKQRSAAFDCFNDRAVESDRITVKRGMSPSAGKQNARVSDDVEADCFP